MHEKVEQDHLRMNNSTGSYNHLRSIDLFRSTIIENNRSKIRAGCVGWDGWMVIKVRLGSLRAPSVLMKPDADHISYLSFLLHRHII